MKNYFRIKNLCFNPLKIVINLKPSELEKAEVETVTPWIIMGKSKNLSMIKTFKISTFGKFWIIERALSAVFTNFNPRQNF